MQKEIRDEINRNTSEITFKQKSYNENKLVFKKLRKELKNTNHIIFHNIPDASFSSNKFWFTIYDVDNNIYYDLETLDYNPKEINIINTSLILEDNQSKFIFDNFIKKKCDTLKKRGNMKLSGVRNYEAIYEINLKNKNSSKCYFKNFILTE